MRPFQNFSINTKISLLVTLAVGIALLLCGAAFLVHDFHTIRAARVQEYDSLAEVLGANLTAAVVFHDPDTAEELLSSLQKQETVEFAAVYDKDGQVFATYGDAQDNDFSDVLPLHVGHTYTSEGHLCLVREIQQDGERIGTVFLYSRMDDLRAVLIREVEIVLVIMIVSLAAAMFVSRRVQRAITRSTLDLAEVAQQIITQKDYSLRVNKTSNDELGSLCDEFNAMLDEIQKRDNELQIAHDQLEQRVAERTAKLTHANSQLSREVAERACAETELESVHGQLVDAARRAGMAEVATGVLHNVGNVLNSINVSSTLLSERLRDSQLSDLRRAVDLMNQHLDDLPAFFTEDEQGRQLPRFLDLLAEHLVQQKHELVEEVRVLNNNVDHVKTIIAMQQSYAGVAGVIAKVKIAELIQDAIRMNSSSLDKYQIQLTCDVGEMPELGIDKHRLLQILINLVTNAKDALAASDRSDRQLIVRARRQGDDWVRIDVIDNGIGIAPDNLTRIFSHGFTTKKRGHGFGLHSSANAAREMGGALSVHSDGPGCGARFSIELPVVPMEVPVASVDA
ncbi:MAG: GHKL domain-containing protein [Planctomycetes bacterium]|nr:GHKL domain-containing protein [Planctomycetota bacterium]